MAAWVEFVLLRRALNQRIGWTGLERTFLAKLWALALAAATVGFFMKLRLTGFGPRLQGLTILSTYGGLYFFGAWMLGLPELKQFTDQITRRFSPQRALEFIRSIVALVERPPSSGASATRPPRDSTNACPSTCLPR